MLTLTELYWIRDEISDAIDGYGIECNCTPTCDGSCTRALLIQAVERLDQEIDEIKRKDA